MCCRATAAYEIHTQARFVHFVVLQTVTWIANVTVCVNLREDVSNK